MNKLTETLVGVADWRKFIEDRLSGRLVEPPVPPRSEDGPETYLVNEYADSAENKKALIQAATLEILQAARRETVPDPCLGHLFQFVRIARITSVGDQLVALFLADSGRGNPLRKAKGAWQESQLHELMHAIRDLQPAKGPLAWREYLDDPDLAQYAFYGLVESDLDAAVDALPRVIKLEQAGVRISPQNSLAYLLAYWRETRPEQEPVAFLLQRFYYDDLKPEIVSILKSIKSARPYAEVYEQFEQEAVGKNILDDIEVAVLLSAACHSLFSDLRTPWEIFENLRNLINSDLIFKSPGKQKQVYAFTAKLILPYAPPELMAIAA